MNGSVLQEMQNRFSSVEGSLTRLLHRLPGMAYRCTVSPDYEYTLDFVSRGCEALIGVSMEEILRQPANFIEQMMPEEDARLEREILKDCLSRHKPYEMYYRVTPKGQAQKWLWDKGEGVYDAEGRCLYIEGILMDVTEQKTREMSLWEENQHLRSSIRSSYGLGELIGKSEAMQTVYRLIRKAAGSDTSVLLQGETGSGKDLVARTIHELSGLKGRYVPVNCAAIPDQLLESEFFGYVKGAFSGATTNNAGYLAAADGGTLFLDEIGELPLKLQVKLLRALEGKTYTPVGSNETRHSKFRLISATNQDLQAMVQQGNMRSDFYYRIHVLAIQVPSLRSRPADIPLLIEAYAKTRGVTKPLPASVLLRLEQHAWPGNIRELHNALDRFWIFGDLGPDFTPLRPQADSPAGSESLESPEDPDGRPSLREARSAAEKQRILAALERCAWRKGAAANALGITMRTLQRKLLRYGLTRP